MHQYNNIQLLHSQDDTLFSQYGSIIFAYVRVHAATREDAEDITVEVFAAALDYDNLAALTAPDAQLSWLKKVAHNRLIDHYRWQQRHPAVDLDTLTGTLLDDEDTWPEKMVLRSEAQRELRAQVERLPQLQQLVLSLRYGQDMRCPEIARLLGKSNGAVRQLLARTIQQLRVQYRQQVQESGREDA